MMRAVRNWLTQRFLARELAKLTVSEEWRAGFLVGNGKGWV